MGKIDIEVTAEQFKELDEKIQGFYVESEGKYVLDGIHGMQTALQKERDRNKTFSGINPDEAKNALALAGSIDFDPDEARAALALKQELDQKKLVDAGEFDKAKEKIVNEYQEKLDNAQKAKSKLLNTYGHVQLQDALEKGGVRPELKDLVATNLLQSAIQIGEKDGEIVFTNKDAVDSIADLDAIITDMKGTRAELFTSTHTPGSGAIGNGNGVGAGKKWSDLSRSEKTAAIREHGGREEAQTHYQ